MLTRSQTTEDDVFYELPLIKKKVFVSASSTYNYILKDTLEDYLKETNLSENKSLFTQLISKKGNEFECFIIKDLEQSTGLFIPKISNYISDASLQKTIDAMKKGYPLIYSAPVINYKNNTKGIVDLLLRSDCFHYFFKKTNLSREERRIPCKFSHSYHYVVVDIKFITLNLQTNGIFLKNDRRSQSIKSQLCIYNEALGELQGYEPTKAYVLGRRYNYTKNNHKFLGKSYDERLGVVDYVSEDSYIVEETKQAIKWKRTCLKNYKQWKLLPFPSRTELYPNLKVKNEHQAEKKQIAEQLNDITQVWYCSSKHRDILLEHSINSFLDPRCTAELMQFTGKRKYIIDRILITQRQDSYDILPITLKNSILEERPNEYFVDFEIIPEVLLDKLDTSICRREPRLFLIGVGWFKHNSWNYKEFVSDSLEKNGEYKIMKDFITFLKEDSTLYHWNHIEFTFWKKALERHRIKDSPKKWVDLCKVFTDTPITLKGCLNFSLKNIANTMYNLHMITSRWNTSIIEGLDCSAHALHVYKNENLNHPVFQEIIQYNEIDCKVLGEILRFLRYHYSNTI